MKRCEYPPCRQPARPGGRFCCGTHRQKDWDRRNPRVREGAVQRPRRASRDGNGLRVYMTADVLEDLLASRPHQSLLVARWIDAANERFQRKEQR